MFGPSPVNERAVAFARELERADETVAATLADLDELAKEVETLRARAVELEALAIRLPAERERLRAAAIEAVEERERWRAELARAQADQAEAERGGDRDRRAATRAVTRAKDAVGSAERRVHTLEGEAAELELEAEAASEERDDLVRRGHEVYDALRERPGLADQVGGPPAGELSGLADWGSRARASLFVLRGRLAAEREALIRQANELGAAVLGEPLTASSAAVVLRRLEAADPGE